MPKYQPANAVSINLVLLLYVSFLEQQGTECRAAHAEALNELLDKLLQGDAFGTEGQCDPRGDHRE